MARLAFIASLALSASACGSPEAQPTSARASATLAPREAEGARSPGVNNAIASPPPRNALTTTPPSLSAPKPPCAFMAQNECYGTLAAACAAVACPSEMCAAAGEQPATVRCQR